MAAEGNAGRPGGAAAADGIRPRGGGGLIRVLFVSHSLPLPGTPLSNVGGMQRLAVETPPALAAHPEVRLSSLLLETRVGEDGGADACLHLARLLREIPRRVREERIDVVLFSSMVTAAARRSSSAPRIAAAGALTAAMPVGRDVTLPNPLYQRLVPRVLRALDLVLPISRATGEECLARGLDPEQRMHVVPCGIDAARFPPVEDRRAARGGPPRALARRRRRPSRRTPSSSAAWGGTRSGRASTGSWRR